MTKPKHFLIFKIIGFACIPVAVLGIVLTIIGFGDFEHNWFLFGMIMLPVGFFGTFFGLINGFAPEIAKASAQTAKYIQNENKELLRDLATASAEINKDAVTTLASAVREEQTDTVFCKHCGRKIDSDSRFCSHCGGEQ